MPVARTLTLAALALGAAALTAAAPAGRPQLGDYGYDAAGADHAVKAGDDFYGYANGNWQRTAEIPADRPTYGMFVALDDLSKTRTRDILEGSAARQAEGTTGRKAGDYYHAFMDERAIEALGAAPLQAELAGIAAVRDEAGLAREMGALTRAGVRTAFDFAVGIDDKDPDAYIPGLAQGGLGLPDRDYYLKEDAAVAAIRAKYAPHIAAMLRLAGYADPDGSAAKIVALETEIARVHWTREESRQAEKTYNKLTFAGLPTAAPGFDWAAFAQGANMAGRTDLLVAQPSAVAGEAKLVDADAAFHVMKAYLTFKTEKARARRYCRAPFVNERCSPSTAAPCWPVRPQLKVRWKRGVAADVGGARRGGRRDLRRAIFPAGDRRPRPTSSFITSWVAMHDAAGAYRRGWIRRRAQKAVVQARCVHAQRSAIRSNGAIIRGWRSVADDAYGNDARATAFEFDRRTPPASADTRPTATEWGMTPMTINAYANPVWNEIVFPAAILQPPFFDRERR